MSQNFPLVRANLSGSGPLQRVTQNTTEDPRDAAIGAFSTDALLLWVQQRVGDLDDGIRSRMGLLKQRKEIAAQLNQAAQVLRGTHGNTAAAEAALKAAQDLVANLPAGTPGKAEMLAELSTGGREPNWEAHFAGKLEARATGMTTSGDIEMISIQSLISSRAAAIQFASTAVRSLDDSAKSVIGNIGR